MEVSNYAFSRYTLFFKWNSSSVTKNCHTFDALSYVVQLIIAQLVQTDKMKIRIIKKNRVIILLPNS